MTAFSCASREGCCLPSRTSASMPWARAMSSTGAPGRSQISTTIEAGMRAAAAASVRARKFEPRPEARTPTRSGSDIVHPGLAGHDLANLEALLARGLQPFDDDADVGGRDDQHEGHAHVARPAPLGVVHRGRALDGPEDGRHHPGARVDAGAPTGREHARQVLADAA